MPKVVIIDLGIGNLFSITCALKKIGLETVILSSTKNLRNAHAVVLPGVGNFKEGAQKLQLIGSEIVRLCEAGLPFFGICLGMQLIFEDSEEGIGNGLSLLKGRVLRLPERVKTPHMGWNTIKISKPCELLDDIDEGNYFYFVHSYYGSPKDRNVIVAETDYGIKFTSVAASKNVYGVQFHPEKSGEPGERILRNFVRLIKR